MKNIAGKLPTVRNILKKKHKDDDTGYITLRVGIAGISQARYKSHGIAISENDWNAADQVVKKSHPDYAQINSDIWAEKQRVIDALKNEKGRTFTVSLVDGILQPVRDKGTFLQFYDNYIEVLRGRKLSAGYINHFLIEYNAIRKFGGAELSFEDITPDFLERYERSLNVAGTTLHGKMKRLREVLNRAIARDKMKGSQIADYKWPEYRQPERNYLTLSETESIAECVYTGKYDYDSEIKKTACYFLVECYGGVRISDWRTFTIETLVHGDNFKCRAKKNGEPIYLPLKYFTRLKRILSYISANKIVFDITPQAANRLLKYVAKGAGITKKITSHNGRHTFGTMLGELRWTTAEIAEAMGISEQTAKTYVKHLREKVKNAAERCGGL